VNLLVVEKLEKRFGGVQAVRDCDFVVKEGTITGLIGPNGAGKTTVFNMLTGLIKPDNGRILLQGKLIDGMEPHEVFRMGVSRTFQLLRIFPKLSALENVMLAIPGKDEHPLDRILKPRVVKAEEANRREKAIAALRLVNLHEKMDLPAGELSYGQQKLLDIARCVAADAKIILLDEPVAGVNPVLRAGIANLLKRLQKSGKTILLIEHDMTFVMGLCDTIVVMDHGEEIAVGTPAQIKKNKRVIGAYLGEER
jgi:ABC-type branched-subunit amino acid transport system ATPase component